MIRNIKPPAQRTKKHLDNGMGGFFGHFFNTITNTAFRVADTVLSASGVALNVGSSEWLSFNKLKDKLQADVNSVSKLSKVTGISIAKSLGLEDETSRLAKTTSVIKKFASTHPENIAVAFAKGAGETILISAQSGSQMGLDYAKTTGQQARTGIQTSGQLVSETALIPVESTIEAAQNTEQFTIESAQDTRQVTNESLQDTKNIVEEAGYFAIENPELVVLASGGGAGALLAAEALKNEQNDVDQRTLIPTALLLASGMDASDLIIQRTAENVVAPQIQGPSVVGQEASVETQIVYEEEQTYVDENGNPVDQYGNRILYYDDGTLVQYWPDGSIKQFYTDGTPIPQSEGIPTAELSPIEAVAIPAPSPLLAIGDKRIAISVSLALGLGVLYKLLTLRKKTS